MLVQEGKLIFPDRQYTNHNSMFFSSVLALLSNKYRLAKLLRLLRLVRVAKVLKWMMGNTGKKKSDSEDDTDNGIGMKMSVVGRKMTESITKKGTLIV